MCKSKAEGGQRCSGHALSALNEATDKFHAAMGAYENGDLGDAALEHFEGAVDTAMIAYASTIEGAKDLSAQYDALDPADTDKQEALLSILDDGAILAQQNREVENAYRAHHGFKALTTPVPQTLAQERAAADAEAARAAATAAWAADPLGLRAEQAHLRPVTAQETAYRSPAEARDGMLDMKAVEQIKTEIDSPRYTEAPRGFRGRRARRSENADALQRGARFGPAFAAAVEKYDGRFDARQIERAAQLLTLHAPATSDTQQFVAAHLDSTLNRSLWSYQHDPTVSGETMIIRGSTASTAADAHSSAFGVEAEFDLPEHLRMPERREPGRLDRALEKIQVLSEDEVRTLQRGIWIGGSM